MWKSFAFKMFWALRVLFQSMFGQSHWHFGCPCFESHNHPFFPPWCLSFVPSNACLSTGLPPPGDGIHKFYIFIVLCRKKLLLARGMTSAALRETGGWLHRGPGLGQTAWLQPDGWVILCCACVDDFPATCTDARHMRSTELRSYNFAHAWNTNTAYTSDTGFYASG